MGKLEARQRLTVVRRLCGHDSMGPSGVLVQSFDRTNLPISPPPTSQSFESTDSPQGHSCPRPGRRECLESFFGRFRSSRYDLGFRKRSPKGSSGCRAKDVSFGYDLQLAIKKTMPI